MNRAERKLHEYIDQAENGSTSERRAAKHGLAHKLRDYYEAAVFEALKCESAMCFHCIDLLIAVLGKDGERRYTDKAGGHLPIGSRDKQ